MKGVPRDESGRRQAVVTGGEGPSGDFREPGIRVAPLPWVPASAGTTVWRGFRIKSGDGGMGTDVLSPLRGRESNPETVRKIGRGC